MLGLEWPTSLVLDACVSCGAIAVELARGGAALDFAKPNAKLGSAIIGCSTTFITKAQLAAGKVRTVAVLVNVVSTNFARSGMNELVVVVAVFLRFARGTHTVSVSVFVFALTSGRRRLLGAIFIHCAVAVVVDIVVANFCNCRGYLVLTSCPLSILAGLFSPLACADSVGVRRSAVAIPSESFINRAVAIVVFSIANLSR